MHFIASKELFYKMSLLTDYIKIKYSQEGYLPNYPYHLLSDKGCMNAFLSGEVVSDLTILSYKDMLNTCSNLSGYFIDTYIEPMMDQLEDNIFPYDESYGKSFVEFISFMIKTLNSFDTIDNLPYWLQSYMVGEVVGPSSDIRDRHDLLVLLGVDNLDDEFGFDSSYACYIASSKWVKKLDSTEYRPPCPFGEPHVIKYGRLQAS